jgi:hypothetical protein
LWTYPYLKCGNPNSKERTAAETSSSPSKDVLGNATNTEAGVAILDNQISQKHSSNLAINRRRFHVNNELHDGPRLEGMTQSALVSETRKYEEMLNGSCISENGIIHQQLAAGKDMNCTELIKRHELGLHRRDSMGETQEEKKRKTRNRSVVHEC